MVHEGVAASVTIHLVTHGRQTALRGGAAAAARADTCVNKHVCVCVCVCVCGCV